jgi:microcystin-dependent protein
MGSLAVKVDPSTKALQFPTASDFATANGFATSASALLVGEIRTYAGFTAPSGWLFPFGQSVLRSTYAALFTALTTSATVTFDNQGGFLRCTWTGHPFAASGTVYTPISFAAGTSTPTGITAGTVYYVLPTGSTSQFHLSTTPGGGDIAYTNSGTGTQTATALFYGAADSTHFNLPDLRGRVMAFRDNMGGSAAGRMSGDTTQGIDGNVLGNSGGEQSHTLISTEIDDGISVTLVTADTDVYARDGAASAHNNVQPSLILNAIIYTGV